jgi:hypothetical protein
VKQSAIFWGSIAAIGGILFVAVLGGCGSALSAADLGSLAASESNCVNTSATLAADRKCRNDNRVVFCAAHPGVGSMCLADGGAVLLPMPVTVTALDGGAQ